MKYSFAALSQNLWSRKFGGTTVGVANPYVSGYHFIWFSNLPRLLYAYTQNGSSGISSNGEIQNILAASCLSVTPPGGTLNKIDFTGLGGTKWAVPGTVDYGDSVSIKFLEFENTPILDIFHGWIKMIRDYRTGTTDMLAGDEGDGYTKKTYAAFMYYWTTAPDGLTVQYYAAYDGVFPLKDPQDIFSSDVESVGRVDIEIDFNVDYIWHEPWVKDKCASLAQSLFRQSRDTIRTYGQTEAGA